MQLSTYFSLAELISSQTADRRGIKNIPNQRELANLQILAENLDKVRVLLGRPIFISSGFRCVELNKAIGGSGTSDHVKGWAADIKCPGFGSTRDVFKRIKDSCIEFDQLIMEFPDSPTGGWVHISFSPKKRRQCLSYVGAAYSAVV